MNVKEPHVIVTFAPLIEFPQIGPEKVKLK